MAAREDRLEPGQAAREPPQAWPDFADAADVFAGITHTIEDDRFDYGEARFITLGMLGDVVVVIAHTETTSEARVISMRKATSNEQVIYFENI